MKKIIAFILVFILSAGAGACSGGDNDKPAVPTLTLP